ncbi:shikimate dehydrogenase [Campylobacter sp. RM13119]|uniref:shikimate dehydrogenase n=1 Tax=Campylobacter TaxID=194 RepID=UPI0014766174|nr:shikimate dehydrogenase [Campylobacter sp. RM13119]MBE3022821.1 shikimate dehydrogenase [Campylobacter sp. 7477a]MBE3605668.1 shikimate dehydrogenase [Campylobacter sp. RM13119]
MQTFALFGDPVAHSISPRLHNKALRDLGLDALYTRVLLKDGSELMSKFRSLKLDGANVTVPHKEHALNLADVASPTATCAGSANTLVLKNDKIYAYNTDTLGFMRAIAPFGDIKTALIIGAGGTAKALAYVLQNNGVEVEILNRSKERIQDLSQNFNCFSWDEFRPKGYDLVINSTSAGLKDDILCAPVEILLPVIKGSNFAFDVIYNRATPFLNLAQQHNLTCKNGADMLLFQAVFALNLFYDSSLDETKIEKSMREVFRL